MGDPAITQPVAIFLTIMAVILIAPMLSERVRLPGIVGLILGGILVGPHGLGLLTASTTIILLSTVGLIYLMFNAGLEVDLAQFTRVRRKAIVFAVLTYSIPQVVGLAMGRLIGLSWSGSILFGSVFASFTLVAFPVASEMGILRDEAVAVTIGTTVFTDVTALLVLAVLAGGASSAGINPLGVLRLVGLMGGYTLLVLWGVPRLGKLFFNRFTGRVVEFQFVLVVLFVAALLADLIGMNAIVGAFLAGLAINSTLPSRSAVVERVIFLGEAFFIPIFLMYIGILLNPIAIVTGGASLIAGGVMLASVYLSKLAAAWLAAKVLRYSHNQMMVMWGLSQAQAAATLATVLVGTQIGILSQAVSNGAILMILCTSITSPLLVQHYGSRLEVKETLVEEKKIFERILIPINNPHTQENLITLAGIFARSMEGEILPLNVIHSNHRRETAVERQKQLLEANILKDPETKIHPLRRVDDSVSRGILHAALENEVSMIMLGWSGRPSVEQVIFGNLLDDVIWKADSPVLVCRLGTPINAMKRVLLVLPQHSLHTNQVDRSAQVAVSIAMAVNLPLLVLTEHHYLDAVDKSLEGIDLPHPAEIKTLSQDVVTLFRNETDERDLAVVPTTVSRIHFRSSLGYLPERLAAASEASLVVAHFPARSRERAR
jgi:Kef-type K+ transport system membrane component KefB/nucleotide-binding universal stress UspA family protein